MKNVLIVIAARGGSTRVPRKNVTPLCGEPLLNYTLRQVAQAGLTERTVVSTDDAEITALSEAAGIRALQRPLELASHTASTEAVLLHALQQAPDRDSIEWIVTLPPTHPFRKPETIKECIEEAMALPPEFECLFSVTETLGDYWKKNAEGGYERLFKEAPRSQQERKRLGFGLYEENSAIYVTRAEAIARGGGKAGTILGKHACPQPIDAIEAVDINTHFDLQVAEALIKAHDA